MTHNDHNRTATEMDGSVEPDRRVTLDEEGSLVTEYGLIAIVGATIASLVVKWASGGSIWELFDAVTDHVRVLLGV